MGAFVQCDFASAGSDGSMLAVACDLCCCTSQELQVRAAGESENPRLQRARECWRKRLESWRELEQHRLVLVRQINMVSMTILLHD